MRLLKKEDFCWIGATFIILVACLIAAYSNKLEKERLVKSVEVKVTTTQKDKEIQSLTAEIQKLRKEQELQGVMINKAWTEIFQLQDQDEVISRKFKHK